MLQESEIPLQSFLEAGWSPAWRLLVPGPEEGPCRQRGTEGAEESGFKSGVYGEQCGVGIYLFGASSVV